MDPEVTQELEEQLRQLNQTLSQLNGVMSDQSKVVTSTTTTVQQSNTAEKNNRQATQQNSQAQDKLAEASKAASDAIDKASQNFSSALSNGTQALSSFQSALFSSQEGMAKYGKAAESAGNAAFDVGKNFGLLGGGIGLLISIFGKVVGEVFKLNDNIINMRDSFTKTAGILPTTTSELGNLAKQARFSLDDMQKLSKATNGLGQNLLGLGGYAGQGAIKFMKMAAVSDDVRRQYGRLGVSQEQLLDLQSKYVEMQGVSGQAMANQSKTADQLRKESLAYADNLIKMSSLTGLAADDLQKERDAAMMEYEEQLQIAAENQKISELRAQGRDKEADAIAQEQANRKELITRYTDMYGKEEGQLAGRLMRQGGYDEKTAGLAVRDPNMLKFTQDLKTSKNAVGDIMAQADKTNKSYDEATTRYGKALQFGGTELGKNIGIGQEAITRRNKYGEDMSKSLEKITKDMDVKKQAGTDPLADSIEGVRSFEREKKAQLQSFLESIDPMRVGFDTLKKMAIAAAVALTAVTAIIVGPKIVKGAKAVGSGISKGYGALKSLFGRGKGAAGAASTVADAAKGAVGAAGAPDSDPKALGKVSSAANSSGGSKVGGFLMGLTNGLEAAGKAGTKIITGAGYLSAAIAAIGAGIAAATWLMGAALPNLAKGLKSFEKLNGPNLKAVGIGMAGLGAGILAMGAGGVADAIGNVVSWFVGGEDPIEKTAKQIKSFESIDLDAPKVENNSKAVIAFAKAMVAVSGISGAASAASAAKSVADSITGYFGGKPPTEELVGFSLLKINAKQTKNNAQAFVAFSEAMAAYKGFGKPTAVIGSAIATAASKFFGVKPPLEEFVYFSNLNINEKKTITNAKAFVDFADAMSKYRGGPGLIDTVSSLLGKGFGAIFGQDGPVEAFRKFAKEDFGPMASTNAENFKKYAETVGAFTPRGAPPPSGSPGSTNPGSVTSNNSSSPGIMGSLSSLAGGAVEAGKSAASSVYDLGSRAWSALTGAVTGNEKGVKPEVLGRKKSLEKIMGNKLNVSSGFRPGTANHGSGDAIDLGFNSNPMLKNSDDNRNKLMANAINLGFTGIGAEYRAPGGAHIHLDTSHKTLTGWGSDYTSKTIAKDSPWLASYLPKVRGGLKAKNGGVFSGPGNDLDAGYSPSPAAMPGSEMVSPLNLNSVLMKLAKTPANNTTNKSLSTSKSSTGNQDKAGRHTDQATLNLQLYGMIARKIERIVTVVENSHDTHGKMLRHART